MLSIEFFVSFDFKNTIFDFSCSNVKSKNQKWLDWKVSPILPSSFQITKKCHSFKIYLSSIDSTWKQRWKSLNMTFIWIAHWLKDGIEMLSNLPLINTKIQHLNVSCEDSIGGQQKFSSTSVALNTTAMLESDHLCSNTAQTNGFSCLIDVYTEIYQYFKTS